MHVIVSLDKQTATLFSNGIAVAQAPISSGTRTHPTPLGVFSVIQKRRHHVSNIYNAKMPFMQRLTWSGTALHEGPLPGYPASHGCVRMTREFSELLWDVTKIGTRVIVTRPEAIPVEIDHPALLGLIPTAPATVPPPTDAPPTVTPPTSTPRVDGPSAALPQAAREAEARMVRTADVSNRLPRAVIEDSARPMVAAPLANAPSPEQATKLRPEVPAGTASPATANELEPDRTAAQATTAQDSAAGEQAGQAVNVQVVSGQVFSGQAVSDQVVNGLDASGQADSTGPIANERTPPAQQSAGHEPVNQDLPKQETSKQNTTGRDADDRSTANAAPDADPKVLAAEAARAARRNASPVSVFVSRRDGKLYVRQAKEPLFTAPVTIAEPDRPIGTHVFTAMEPKDAGLRWTVVTIPSANPRAEEPAKLGDKTGKRRNRPVKAAPVDAGPPSDASEALTRIDMPPEAIARIAQLVKPGSSLIVSDNRLSRETGKGTGLIVETP